MDENDPNFVDEEAEERILRGEVSGVGGLATGEIEVPKLAEELKKGWPELMSILSSGPIFSVSLWDRSSMPLISLYHFLALSIR